MKLICLKEQKRELEAKVQTLELKTLTRNDKEAFELKLSRERVAELENKVELLEKEKGQIFENSIKEITEQKVKLEEFQRENAMLGERSFGTGERTY